MKTPKIIFLIAELVAVVVLLIVLDWQKDVTENLSIIGLVGGAIWGTYERYGKLKANQEIKNLHKYKGRD